MDTLHITFPAPEPFHHTIPGRHSFKVVIHSFIFILNLTQIDITKNVTEDDGLDAFEDCFCVLGVNCYCDKTVETFVMLSSNICECLKLYS